MRGQVQVAAVARPRVSLVSALSLTSPVSRPREKSTGPFLWIKLTPGPAEPPTQSYPQGTPSALLRLHAWRFFAGQVEEISVNPLEPVDDGPEDNDVVA